MKQISIFIFLLLSVTSTYSHAEGGGDTVFERMEQQRNAAMDAKRKSEEDKSSKSLSTNDWEKEKAVDKHHS